MDSSYYKYCIVPQCTSTSIKTPNKLFIYVPNNQQMRKKWLTLARKYNAHCLSTKSRMYFCEDHFNLPNDMLNYTEYHIMGKVSQVRMKPGCIPSKFACQEDRRKRTCSSTEQSYVLKKQRMTIIAESLKEQEESCTPSSSYNAIPHTSSENENKDTTLEQEHTSRIESEPVDPLPESNLKTESVEPEPELEPDSEPELEPDSEPELEPDPELEPTLEPKSEPACEPKLKCTQCQKVLLKFVFLCVECLARSCSACDARGLHAAHLVLRAPVARPESELKLVLNKIRDALCLDVEETSQTNPDQPVEESPQEPEYESIKMEIESEEDDPLWLLNATAPANTDAETIVPDIEHQIPQLPWPEPAAAEGSGLPFAGPQSDSSCTLTASSPSDSSSDDDQACPTRPSAPSTRPRFNDEMNRYIVRTYYTLSQTEKSPLKIFTLMKQVFAIAFPHMKVHRSNLQSQFSHIFIKKLFTDDEIQAMRNEVRGNFISANNEKTNVVSASKLLSGKGRQLELLTVRSGMVVTGLPDKTSEVNPRPFVRKVVVPIPVSSHKTSEPFKYPRVNMQVRTVVGSSQQQMPQSLRGSGPYVRKRVVQKRVSINKTKAKKRVRTVVKESSDQKCSGQLSPAPGISDSFPQQSQSLRGRTRRPPARLLT
ncbi:uncharacterized protein LOC135084212 isoform X3 [Ostrinia nubilalis]|uniref:uncharacterized protein LOC135084212 isoform X3 n=1 Tax=Ostrinia nubilalis TaxID=29057 RepID=UPI0030823EC2